MTDRETAQQVWNNIDGILVINLDKDKDRIVVWEKEMQEHIPAQNITRLSAVAGWELAGYKQKPWFSENTGERAIFWGGSAGCALSHRKAIEMAKAKGWEKVLILEDDAQFMPDAQIDRIGEALQHLHGGFLLYLGCHEVCPYAKCIDLKLGLWEIEGALATHAYILSAGMYDKLLDELPTEETVWDWLSRHKAIDVFYRDRLSKMRGVRVYALFPNLVQQNSMPSRIVRDNTSTNPEKKYALPKSRFSLGGLAHLILTPYRKLKLCLNSIRTHRRAVRKGFPGYNKRQK